MLQINHDKCLSVKNKKTHIQCCHKRKDGKIFCGIHLRAKKVVRVDELPEFYLINIKKEKIDINDKLYNDDSKFYTKDFLLNSKVENLKVGLLRNTIKHYNLLKIINKDQSKRLIYRDLMDYILSEKYYLENINDIIKIQRIFRGYDVYRRKKCINDVDCILLVNKYEISSPFFFKYHELSSDKHYAFDIRTLTSIIKGDNPKNPFTLCEIPQISVNLIKDEIQKRKLKGIKLELEEDKLTPEQEIEARAIDIFHQFDVLGNYTNHKWFYDLSLYRLQDLYHKSEDMFNYRINLPIDEKKKYVKDGLVFKISLNIINKIKDKYKLQNIILDEYEKFLIFNSNSSDKKTAIMWMLIALTEVSDDARNAMPHLDQGLF